MNMCLQTTRTKDCRVKCSKCSGRGEDKDKTAKDVLECGSFRIKAADTPIHFGEETA